MSTLLFLFLFLFSASHLTSSEKIFAVMITGKDEFHKPLAELSIQSFLEQTYQNKELIIINDGNYSLKKYESKQVREIRLDKKHPLGTLRNIGLSYIPENQLFVQWDDDDWHHPNLIKKQYNFLKKHSAHMCSLKRQIQYHFKRNAAWMSTSGVKEGTIMCRKKKNIAYIPDIEKGEDTYFYWKYAKKHKAITWNNPSYYYLRFFHGHNTWGDRFDNTSILDNEWQISEVQAAYLKEIVNRYLDDIQF